MRSFGTGHEFGHAERPSSREGVDPIVVCELVGLDQDLAHPDRS